MFNFIFDRFSKSSDSMSTPSTPTTPLSSPPVEPYDIQIITKPDVEKVIGFLRKFFFRDEPLNVNVKLLEGDDATCLELEEFSVKSIKDGLSLMAVSESGKVVGVCLNGAMRRNDVEEDEEDCPNEKFAKILNLLETVDKQADIFGKFPDVNSVMNVKILSVDTTWRGRGIAKQLMDRTRDMAREQGYGIMRVDCTSNFSARAIARLGFECVYTLKYADHKVDGQVVFEPEHPHTEVAVYIQRIVPNSNL
ncbi:PREDICTED: dopamine N-acetyltransferase-like isoform X2 [Nicrophorus vespilloides]|uniref:Dopamine N-acetyltransferase-like isoform X2 n=1 Tax=Nicrophorus vespilloides TaxID=110193 RepID=A0ABM1NIH1_NICVS|nr:PREDICTED: dopamine N-acetyltransferase-like isoform X2 [Nicrophorus vespilloides]